MRRAAAPRFGRLRTGTIELFWGARNALHLVITERVVGPMLQAISITPEMTRVIRDARQASTPRTWREISEELGISLSSAVNVAKRAGLYQQIYRERFNNSPSALSPAAVQPVVDDDLTQPSTDDDVTGTERCTPDIAYFPHLGCFPIGSATIVAEWFWRENGGVVLRHFLTPTRSGRRRSSLDQFQQTYSKRSPTGLTRKRSRPLELATPFAPCTEQTSPRRCPWLDQCC